MSILSAILEAWTSDGGSVNGSVNASDGKQGAKDTSEPFTGQKTSGDREHVHIEGRWAPLRPKVVEDGSEAHSYGKESLWDNEALYHVMNN